MIVNISPPMSMPYSHKKLTNKIFRGRVKKSSLPRPRLQLLELHLERLPITHRHEERKRLFYWGMRVSGERSEKVPTLCGIKGEKCNICGQPYLEVCMYQGRQALSETYKLRPGQLVDRSAPSEHHQRSKNPLRSDLDTRTFGMAPVVGPKI